MGAAPFHPTVLRAGLAGALAILLSGLASVEAARAQSRETGPSGLPLPRFVSLKSSPVNVRRGPGRDYEVAWTFMKPAVPVEVTAEFENWRKIRDADGDEGWIYHSLLSGRRTVLVTTPMSAERVALRQEREEKAPVTAYLSAGVLADIASCEPSWCRLKGGGASGQSFDGWAPKSAFWGAYGDEVLGRN